jgi:S1-C subfamily serine protease
MQSLDPGRPSSGTPAREPVRTDPAVSLPPPSDGPAHGDRPHVGADAGPRTLRGPGGTLRVVVPAAVLSAILASGLTVALAGTGGSSPSTAASTAAPGGEAATVTSSTADATLARVAPDGGVEEVAAIASRSVVTITVAGTGGAGPVGAQPSGVGSGIIVGEDGLILTNAHVVEGGGTLTVTLPDGTDVAATVVATEPAHDLAVIRAEASGLTVAALADDGVLVVGQAVVAVGSPLGTFTDTVTLGIVSGLDRSIDVADATKRSVNHLDGLIQTDAAINAGNSGGPLLDLAGRVVGIVTANASDAQGVGFAVPIAAALDLLARASA